MDTVEPSLSLTLEFHISGNPASSVRHNISNFFNLSDYVVVFFFLKGTC